GNLWPYLYGTPEDANDPVRGGILYNEMLEGEKDYYLYKYEAELFQSKGHLLTSYIGSNATFIELGPGSQQSLRLKTLPLLQTCTDLSGYVGIDISQSFLDKGLEVIRSGFPDISISGIQQDFTQLENLPEFEKPVIFFKGSTIANMRRDEVPIFISKIKDLVGKNHYLLLVHDANQDEISLMKAYDNQRMALFMENIMYRVHRDANLVGMSPEAFRYKPEWESDTHDLKHVLTATKAQKFDFQGQTIEIEEGQKFHTLSSFKYPTEVFQEILSSTGYKPIDVVQDNSNRLSAHVFQG
ncbi:MAG: L-histidine N(alpha)-methyltransferase, partial [Cyanobacteria bacterium J06632_19]